MAEVRLRNFEYQKTALANMVLTEKEKRVKIHMLKMLLELDLI